MKKLLLLTMVLLASCLSASAEQAETLDRGVIALYTGEGVFVSWRAFTDESRQITYDVYRDGVKVNDEALEKGSNYTDADGTAGAVYVIKGYLDGEEVFTSEEAEALEDVYMRISLDRPDGMTMPDESTCTYSPNDCSVGDVDGDGQYEIIVKWDPSNSRDNSLTGYTGNVYLDCYELDGTKLWRIDLGRNIRAGAHYTQFMVYDLDGDGKAEVACKTAPGTVDGAGNYVLMDGDSYDDDYRNSDGIIMSGSEYLTVFNGETGAEITTVSYVPLRSVQAHSSSGWGDNYGNRCERYLACVADLGGDNPSLVMCRGYYTMAYLCAWDFDGSNLTQRWLHESTTSGSGAYGEGAHSLAVGDVDDDGYDEIVYGAACIDHDGSLLYRTGAGHGDALHLGDFDPDRDGLEVFMVHEETGSSYKWDSEFRDAATGTIIWGTTQSGYDIGRGLVGDLSDEWRGYEIWPGSYYVDGENVNATFDCLGNLLVNKRPSTCFRIYWDGDLNDELFDGKYDSSTGVASPVIEKRSDDLTSNSTTWAFSTYNAQSCNTTKATPCLQADILGDWREELILWDGDNSSDLLLFSTTIESEYRVPCLMEDHNYRLAIAWQNVAYNQPPHLSYYLQDYFSSDAVIVISSGNLDQTIDIGYAIDTIYGNYKHATSVYAEGLPDGVSLSYNGADSTFYIYGTPTVTGEFAYTIYTDGGITKDDVEGTITVKEAVVLTKLAYYPFDVIEDDQTVNEVYGYATCVGYPFNAGYGWDGNDNSAFLDGETSYFTQEAYEEIQLGTKDFSIEMWLASTDDNAYIFHKGSTSANSETGATGCWVGLELKSSKLKFAIDDNSTKSEAAVDEVDDYFNGEWFHVVMVRNHSDGVLSLYLNGQLVAESEDNTGDVSDNYEELVIGNAAVNYNNYYFGVIDNLCIYEGAMSINQVRTAYEGGDPNESAGSGIKSTVQKASVNKLTLVNAQTGMVVGKGVGAPENVMNSAKPGIYILILDNGTTREYRKVIKN